MNRTAQAIKMIMDRNGYSQTYIANSLNVTPSYISKLLKKDDCTPSDMFIDSLCNKFNVNESWLRFGEGEIFRKEENPSINLAKFFAKIKSGDDLPNVKILMQALANLGPEYWEEADQMLKDLLEESKWVSDNKKDTC